MCNYVELGTQCNGRTDDHTNFKLSAKSIRIPISYLSYSTPAFAEDRTNESIVSQNATTPPNPAASADVVGPRRAAVLLLRPVLQGLLAHERLRGPPQQLRPQPSPAHEGHEADGEGSHRRGTSPPRRGQGRRLISIKLGFAGGDANSNNNGANANDGKGGGAAAFKKGGFKKSGFKSAFAPVGGAAAATEDVEMKTEKAPVIPGREDSLATTRNLNDESDTDDEGYEVYNPRFPTD
ncbi:hypothetical protein CIB48_g11375 [Xylaria polymorpha]|nr:hypothetical protein CIB48_g11375 [Xylaria polymorpha]